MLFKVTYKYTQSSPRGGAPVRCEELVLYSCSEEELVQKVNEFLDNNQCGYRTHISLVDVIKI